MSDNRKNSSSDPLEALEAVLTSGVFDGDRDCTNAMNSLVGKLKALSGKPGQSSEGPPELQRWGELEILSDLRRGAYGTIYRARDPRLDRVVALKLLDRNSPVERDRFLREGKQLAAIRHQNVVTVHGAAEFDGRMGLQMELVEGRTLEGLLRDQGPYNSEEAALIGREVCRALTAVHEAGVLHHDVKPGNVLREAGGRIVLTDFGSAGSSESREEWPIQGTLAYMAPERRAGAEPAATQDVFSVGALLYQLVTGQAPITADAMNSFREPARLRDECPHLPRAFVRVVERALETEPDSRFTSASEMEDALIEFLEESSTVVTQEDRPQRRFAAGALGLAGLLIAALLVLVVSWFQPVRLEGSASLRRPSGPPLQDGDTLTQGDRLELTLRLNRPAHVYLLNEDSAGNLYVMFPDPECRIENPLSSNQEHLLPGLIERQGVVQREYWEVGPGSSAELFLLIASQEPLPVLEGELSILRAEHPTGALPLSSPRSTHSTPRSLDGVSANPEGDSSDWLFEDSTWEMTSRRRARAAHHSKLHDIRATSLRSELRGIVGKAKDPGEAQGHEHRRLSQIFDEAARVQSGEQWIFRLTLLNPPR